VLTHTESTGAARWPFTVYLRDRAARLTSGDPATTISA
jgi:hypothetical protein